MKGLYFLLTLFLFSANCSGTDSSMKHFTLNNQNHMVVRGQVTGESVSKWILDLNKIKSEEINIYISSPGGSIMAGLTFIDQIKQLEAAGKKINCVADIAASMAFIIFQSCPNRYTTSSSILMQHQMSLGLSGQIENVKSYLEFLANIEEDMIHLQAKKMGMGEEEFAKRTVHDWWLSGSSIINNNAADEMVHVGCDSSLLDNTVDQNINTIFGTVVLRFSKCPLSRDPISQHFRGVVDNSVIEDIQDKYIPSHGLRNLVKKTNYNML